MSITYPPDNFQHPLPGLADVSPTTPPDRHYFIPDEHGYYCRACRLPRGNRRHVEQTGVKV
jgi:hypothetical protein